jgi:hypothetical protein
MDLVTILHELAHHVHNQLIGVPAETNHEDHGPAFMAVYISVMDTVRFIPRDASVALFKKRGLTVLDPGPSIASLKRVLKRAER